MKIIIPFRDRGTDPRRAENLEIVQAWWYTHGYNVHVVSDGLKGDAPFNRHRAYNRATDLFRDTRMFVFAEADMLIHPHQIEKAVALADETPGLVVPFTQYRYLSESMTEVLREDYRRTGNERLAEWWKREPGEQSVFDLTPESTMDGGRSIGAVNVVSRVTLDLTGGFTEATHGNWYDDNIIEEGFAYLSRYGTRWVNGPAVHLYHLPGHKGDHLSDLDRRATAHNKTLLKRMRLDIQRNDAAAVYRLMSYRSPIS